jgi:ABC-2 type transport system ATP-binding protein
MHGSSRLIEVHDYHKNYRTTVAVAGLQFTVRPHEILGLVGPNGAGKTTTLRTLAGIIPPTRGALSVAGFDIVTQPVEAKRRLAYVPDDPRLFETLTVWEHIEFMASAYQVQDAVPKAEALLERFELTDKRNTLGQELSRGMRQKVAICCAYLHDPEVLLFDEPHTGLDPRGIRTMRTSIVERAEAGAAVVVSSHFLSLIEDMCTHLLILHLGRQLYCGPMAQARSAFSVIEADASLEEVFFRATEGGAVARKPGS